MTSQPEQRKLQIWRINVLAAAMILIFLVLIGRLWYIQIALGDRLLVQSEENRTKHIRVRAPRGTVVDRDGKILAASRSQFVVMANREKIEENKPAMHTLCAILEIKPRELESIFKKRASSPGAPVRVANDVSLQKVARIGETRMRLPGVSVELDHIRRYPGGPAIAHVIGHLREIDQDQLEAAREDGLDYKPGDYVGKVGIEREYEEDLHGRAGKKKVEVNAFGRVVQDLGEEDPERGKTLELAIDYDLQQAADFALGDQVGAFVALDPRNGEVLALVSKPQYDPNIFVKRIDPADWKAIIDNKDHPLHNRCIQSNYPPGSTFKPMMAISGLEHNVCGPNTTVSCPGAYYLGRKRFGCWKVHHTVNFTGAIAQSCDVWFYTLARKLGIDRMAATAREFGIGSKSGIDMPGEISGNMPDREWKMKARNEKWYPGDSLNTVIGQGAVLTTPLQMAVSAMAVANKGTVYKPHVVKSITDDMTDEKRVLEPEVVRKVKADDKHFELVRNAMLVTVESGTGRVVKMDDIKVAGKTGTAQANGPAHGWFICFAPYDNPTIAMACIVEHGLHGSTSAAPVCKAVLDVFFGKKTAAEIKEQHAKSQGD